MRHISNKGSMVSSQSQNMEARIHSLKLTPLPTVFGLPELFRAGCQINPRPDEYSPEHRIG